MNNKIDIAFIIPSKDGGEGYANLFSSIRENIEYAISKGQDISYKIYLLINGNPEKPNSYLSTILDKDNINVIYSKSIGKVATVNEFLATIKTECIVMLDDDISFAESHVYLAIKEFGERNDLALVSYQTRALPYKGKNLFKRLLYDIINIRSLLSLYKGVDPFLFGRFLLMDKANFIVPKDIINEDLYLGILYQDRYIIRPEEVFYIGEHSISRHIRRVLRLEAGREQIKKIFGERYKKYLDKNKREINFEKLKSLSVYYRFCFYGYQTLRVITNSIIPKLYKHKTRYW